MKESLFLEIVNGNFFMLSFCAILVFARYIVSNWREGYTFLRPAFALTGVFLGEFIIRLNFWFTRYNINTGGQYQTPSINITILGSLIASWAILCTIAVFSPAKLRNRAWILSLLATAIFLFLSLTWR